MKVSLFKIAIVGAVNFSGFYSYVEKIDFNALLRENEAAQQVFHRQVKAENRSIGNSKRHRNMASAESEIQINLRPTLRKKARLSKANPRRMDFSSEKKLSRNFTIILRKNSKTSSL